MRYPLLVLGALAVVVATPEVALAQAATPAPSDQIVLSGDALVPRGTVVGEVVVFSGSATVAGVAQGDVVVLDGPVTISGQVGGDVVGLGGPVRLGSTAQVTGAIHCAPMRNDIVARARCTAPFTRVPVSGGSRP